jgi:hypothetical protein
MGFMNISVSAKERGRKKQPLSLVGGEIGAAAALEDLFQFTKTSLIAISTEVVNEEIQKGFDKNPLRLVDGNPRKDVMDVNPLGSIRYVSRQNIKEIVLYSYQAVIERSPVDTGDYIRSNVVTYNQVPVASTMSELQRWLENKNFADGDKIRILNTVPYARKLELRGTVKGGGRTKWGKPSRNSKGEKNSLGQVRKPNGAYTLATKAIKAKYGKSSFVKYELMLGSTIGLPGTRKTGKDIGRAYVYPSILIYAFDTSIQGKPK